MVTVEEEGEALEQAPMPVTTKAILGRVHRSQRMAAMWAKACLNKYHKSPFLVRDPTDSGAVPASVLLRRKHVMSECTALLGWRSGFGWVSDSGFSSCATPTY